MHPNIRTTSKRLRPNLQKSCWKTNVTVAPCIKTLFQLSVRPRRTLKAAEREQERILGDPLLPSHSPCLEAYSELSWQTKISLFLYNTCFFSAFSSELRMENEYMHIQTWITTQKQGYHGYQKKKNAMQRKFVQKHKGYFRFLLYI